MKRIITSLLFIAFCFTTGIGQILNYQQIGTDLKQYKKCEWTVRLKAPWNNPYDADQVSVDMVITSPNGKKIILPCFFESGTPNVEATWRARFTPRETGTYNFFFQLKLKGKVTSKSKIVKFNAIPSSDKGFLNPGSAWSFQYDNGESFRGIGENICWEARDSDDSKHFKELHEESHFNYDFMLRKLAANGGNFFRTWMIYWNLPVDWKVVKNNQRYTNATGPYNESGMRRLDHLVELCDSIGIHMMLALESHVGYMGEGWEISRYNVANDGPAASPLEFFTLPEAKRQYKNKLRLMIARYGYSPSIAAWEFFNEIDNAMYQGKPEDRIPDDVITSWHDEMSSYLKSNDPYQHMVTTSISHRDVAGMNDIKTMDINQKHIYKHTDAIPATLMEYTGRYNKPYVIGEFGYEWDWNKNFNDFGDEMDSDFKRGLWYGLFNPTPILPMSWWWEFFEQRGLMNYFKNVSLINQLMLENGANKLEQVKITSKIKETFGVQNGTSLFVYLYNPDKSPMEIVLNPGDIANRKITLFDCESSNVAAVQYTVNDAGDLTIIGGKLAAGQDCILIIE